jgi:transcriptional regulator with XRE-family HTH domain
MEEDALPREFGALVRRLRYSRGLSQEGLAQAAKLERAYVGMIERGETNVSLRTAFKLARALGMTLAGLFAEMERAPPDHDR